MSDFENHWPKWMDELVEAGLTWEEIEAAKVILEAVYEAGREEGRQQG